MKKILIFGMSDNLGGVETVIMNYYRNIDKEKIQCDFLYNTEDIAYKEEIRRLGGKTYKITPRGKNFKKYKEDMKNFFKEHANEYSAIWVNLCILCNIDWLKYAKKYGIKTRIVHSHNSQNMTNKFKNILHHINKRFLKKYATDFWACSEEAGKWFYNEKIINSPDFKIINNAIDIEDYKFNERIREKYRKNLKVEEKIVIGHIGRFHFQKNHEFLINVFENMYKKNNDVHLLLIGTGEDEEKIKQIVKNKKIEKNVDFLGMRKDIKNLLQTMDIFIFPSLFEGFPLTLLEVQANGIDSYVAQEGVPKDIKMSENLEFLSLNDSAEKWADIILSKEHKRIDNTESIKEHGYDIKEETRKIENFFESI